MTPHWKMIEDLYAIEMKTISTNMPPTSYTSFKLLKDTRCVRRNSNKQLRYTSITLREGEIYYGIVILHKNRVYIDISDCYRELHSSNRTIYVPIIFDMTGKYMINIVENVN